MRWVLAVITALVLAACGGGDDGGGVRDIRAVVRDEPPRIIKSSKTECHFDGDRQVSASGVVRNGGDDEERNVNIQVRFLDADDVRIDLMTDSVSSLQRGESARWGVSFYPDHPDDVVKCEITTTSS